MGLLCRRNEHSDSTSNSQRRRHNPRWLGGLLFRISLSLFFTSCTEQLPNSFRYLQQQQFFDATGMTGVNTKLDMLWVIDNSPSMGPSQKKIRDGFQLFADR